MKKQEEKQEEVVVENEVQNDYVPAPEEEVKPIEYGAKSLEEIEQERQKFFKTFRVQNTLKWIISVICIAAIVIGCIVVPNVIKDNDNLKTGLMLGIVVAALAGTIGYSVFTKRSMNGKMKKYFNFYYRKVNEFAMDQAGFSEPVLQEPGKIDLQQFVETGLYQNIIIKVMHLMKNMKLKKLPILLAMPFLFCACNNNENADENKLVLTLNKTSLTLSEEKTYQLVLTTSEPTNIEPTWSSKDSTIASVSNDGLVTAIKPGNATGEAKTVNALTATCSFQVLKNEVFIYFNIYTLFLSIYIFKGC